MEGVRRYSRRKMLELRELRMGPGHVGPHGGPPQRQQIVIARPFFGKVELNKAEHAWKPADATKTVEELSKKTENVADEEERLKLNAEARVAAIKLLKKRTRGILNKITPTNFQDLVSDFSSLLTIKDPGHEKTGYQMDCSWDQEETESIVEVIFDKAVEEPLQCPTYVDLCHRVAAVQWSQSEERTFRDVLVKACQRFFEANGGNTERPSDVIAKKLAAATDNLEKRKLEAELNETRNKEKRRITGNIRFIGELYKQGLLVASIMHLCILLLLERRGDEESLECLCKLLESVGSKLEAQSDAKKDKLYDQIGGYYQRLMEISSGKPHKVSSRIKFMILDLIDYRKTGWKVKKGKKETGPKKLEEIRADYEAEEQKLEKTAKLWLAERSHVSSPSPLLSQLSACSRPEAPRKGVEGDLLVGGVSLRDYAGDPWPIKEPITFLKACVAAWRQEVKKVNGAHEFLSSKAGKVAKGPDQDRIVLCLQAQIIVYRRHSEELRHYQYTGYTPLIKTIRLESSDSGLFRKDAPLLPAATELCQLTLVYGNQRSFLLEEGLEALQDAFDRCVSVLSASTAPDDLAVQVATHVARSYAALARHECFWVKLSQMGPVFSDLVHVLYFRELVALSVVGAECVGAFAVCPILQTKLFQAGAVWNLLPNIFHYDFTLDQGGVSKSETTNSQELENKLARSSCEALARLAGLREGCPGNAAVAASLSALLTPYIVRLLADSPVDYVLKLLNSNSRTPVFVWDNGTRSQMLEFVEAQRGSGAEPSEEMGAEFRFEAFAKELVVGGVFLRLFVANPSYALRQPRVFLTELMERFLTEVRKEGTDSQVLETLTSALVGFLQAQPAMLEQVGTQGYVPQVTQALRTKDEPAARSLLLLFHQLSSSALCVETLVASDVLPGLASAIRLRPDVAHEAAKGLRALFARDNSALVGQALRHDFVPFLLSLLDSPLPQCPNPQAVRAEIVQALKAMTTNLEHGPDVQSLLDQSTTWKEFKDQSVGRLTGLLAVRSFKRHHGYLKGEGKEAVRYEAVDLEAELLGRLRKLRNIKSAQPDLLVSYSPQVAEGGAVSATDVRLA